MAKDEADEAMIDEYVDCSGQVRSFRLEMYAGGRFLSAIELRNGEPTGMRLIERVGEDRGIAFWEIRRRIRARLAERDVVCDPRTGKLCLLRDRIRAQLCSSDMDSTKVGPSLLIDDLELSWSDLGRLLVENEGFWLDIVIRDPSEIE